MRLPIGTDTMKVVPCPCVLCTRTCPRATSPVPAPEPGRCRCLRGFDLATPPPDESVRRGAEFRGRDPRPGILDCKRRGAIFSPKAYADLPLDGELKGIGEQVENDLLPHIAVDVNWLREGRAIDTDAARPCHRLSGNCWPAPRSGSPDRLVRTWPAPCRPRSARSPGGC